MIDLSGATFGDSSVPLDIPELNGELLKRGNGQATDGLPQVIGVPSSAVYQILLPLAGTIKEHKLKRLVVTTFNSTSYHGHEAMDELFTQSRKIFLNETLVDDEQIFKKQIAFNVLPQVGEFIGEETSLEKAYHWVAQMGWVWSIQFPMMAIKEMAPDEDEFMRVFRIIFATAGKNQFIDPFAKEGLRSFLGIPHDMDENDGRILGGYIRYMLDVQQVPYEMVRWTKDETWIKVKSEDFTARYEMAPLDELVDAYEAQWNGAAKTLVSPEWSCVIEDRDEEDMSIKVIRKEDSRML